MRQLASAAFLAIAAAPAAAGQTVVNGATIDTQGYSDVCIIAHLGAITATGTATLKAAQGEAADGSDKADLEGSAVVANDTGANKLLVIDIHRPQERFITPILTRTVANSALNSMLVILHNASHSPVTQTNVADMVALNSPAQGQA